eukprot:NODE_2648_length_457_cov_388.772059_g2192_i0.p1 GENE.NODE_2648_length_457_cov_388.772059_g2192_i0~~NODE_2648_length_457_cov_388.772059_g2192_i0.p1  ORF type:complete len:70 (+),score=6.58 NODE_2648_length_457_cov_388.772059_g2192_i0:180-389(+)
MRNPSPDRQVRLRNCYLGCYEVAGILTVYTESDKELVWGSDAGVSSYYELAKYDEKEAQQLWERWLEML